MTKPYKPIICLDFDGVIHSYTSGWKGPGVVLDPPVPGAIDMILHYMDAGMQVAIYSSRSKSLVGRRAMKLYMSHHIATHWERGGAAKIYDKEVECFGDAWRLVRMISWPWFKPSAFITIDDRALCFSGNWESYSPEILRTFKPWNKQ